ncbi:PBECR2 nuclease fold domain-containing protein, partial [Campylobacter upsaliensis]
FNLKSLDEEFIPNLPRELKEALGKEIKLTKGSLYKIVEKGREKYIPQMKQTLQNPDFALRDRDNMLILAKQIEDKQYFTSVNLETKDYFISVSNAPKKENILKNKVENGAEILYQSPNAKSIFYTDTLLQTDKSSANKIDEDIIAQNAKSERAEFESFKDKIKELYTKYEGLSPYDKSESQLRIKLLDEEIEPEIKKEFKNIIDKFKGADNKDKILRVIKENKEELSDYLAFHIALRKDIDIDGHGEGKVDFYDKSIRDFFKLRENKRWSEIDESKCRALAALENLSNKNTSLYFSFKDLNGKVGEFKTYPRIQDLLFYDLLLVDDLKNAVILSTKDKLLKEKLIEKLKAYIDKKIYADFLEYKIKDLESRNPKNSYFENYKDEKWDEEALKSFKKELEDLRANEKGTKLEAKGSEDIIFTDKKGKEHTLTKETQKAWLEAFNLKSLEEAYIPNFKAEVKEAINRVLGGEEIKLTKGSFEKLLKEKRLKYLDRIKPTLENPHSVILQNDGALIFARDYGEEKYFTSVARNDSGEWIIRSNAPKSKNGLNNKILNGGKEIYNDQAASQINASNPYDDIANSNIKLDNESIAQNSHYLELVKEYGEENAKSIIKQKILGENIAQVLENEPVRIRYFKQEAKERKPKETKPSADKTLGQIQKDMRARLKELKAQAKENYERYKNEDKALQKELTNTKDLFKAFEKEFNETEGTILISRAKRRKNDAEGKVETSVFLGNELALRNALDRWERYSGYSEENALEVKERLELLRSYVKRLEKHREDIKAKREQLEQDYQQNEAARSKEMGVIGNYNILSNLKGVSENELYEPFLEKVGGYLSKADFYERHLPFAREEFQKLFNLTPLKEFGTNYAEFYRDGKGAVEKLLKEAEDFKQRGEKGEFKGQVSGAFYKEGLGEIDLVWGDENFGLRHIIDKHGDEFEDIAAELDEIIAKGVLEKGEHRYFIKHNDYKGMIALDYKGKESNAWILTLYKDKSALNPAYQHQIKHNTNTSSETRANGEFENSNIKNANLQKEKVDKLFHGDAEVISAQGKFNELEALNLTDEDIIPQQKIKFAMEKFHYDEKKAKDLLEWHKNSHALTKDENGLPKVFYHGTYSKFRVFRRVGKASGQGFFFTPSQKATEEYGDITLNTFLNIKNPFRADELKINKEADLQKWADILKLDYDKEKYESFKDLKTKLEKVKEATKKAGFKFHSASGGGVYVIDNKGRNSFINLEELDKENKRVVEAFKGLETEDIYFYYVVRNEFDLVLYALNKNDRYFHTSGRDEVKRVLEKLGYDGVVLNDTIITVFNSNQIKHIDNKGSFTDTKGNVTSKKPKDKEAEFSYFNEKSDNIYHSNPHLGAGLVGGTLNGVEQDENGNLSFDPVKFAMGFLGGSVGSFALKKGFQILEKNPELKEKIITELADTLAQGFEKAREKYPLLSTLEPRYIVKNEKGRKIQAKTMLKELEREQNKNLQNIIRQNLQNLPLNNKPLELSEKQVKLLINRFANARNLKEHLNTRADNRKELYALLNDTLENPQIHFIKEGRDKYVKRYKGDVNEPYFYLLITQDKDKIFITHLKTRDIKYLSRQISNAEQIKKGADIIEALSQRAGDDKASASKKDYSK